MFHFYVLTYWISIISENETYDFYVSVVERVDYQRIET